MRKAGSLDKELEHDTLARSSLPPAGRDAGLTIESCPVKGVPPYMRIGFLS